MNRVLATSVLVGALYAGEGEALGQPAATSPAVFLAAATREAPEGGPAALIEAIYGYDDNVLGSGNSLEQPTTNNSVGGQYSGLSAALIYQTNREGQQFKTWANSLIRHYRSLGGFTTTSHQAGALLVQPLGRRFSVQLSPAASYSPYYTTWMLPDDERDPQAIQDRFVLMPDVDFAIVQTNTVRFSGNAAVNMTVSDQSNFTVSYGYARSKFDFRDTDLEVRSAGASFSRRFSRNATMRIGYNRQEGNYSTLQQQRLENLNLGVDYHRPLSRSRRTFIRFSSGSVLAEDGADIRRFYVTGTASLSHQLGRTWIANVNFRRAIRQVEGFVRPVLSDAASASLAGLMNRRTEFMLHVGYYNGTVGLNPASTRFDSYLSSAGVRVAISRTLAAYGEYRIYHYQFEEDALKPLGAAQSMDRSGARVGLSWYVPLFR